MGRDVKRVPLDFDWPQDKIWQGYQLPSRLNERECPDCGGVGSTPARKWVEQIANLLLMLDDDLNAQQRGRGMHPYLEDTGSCAYGAGRPTPDIREFGTGLAGREGGFGHDAIDRWHATGKVIEAAGLDPEVWGICQTCKGYGSIEKYDGQRAEAEAWEPTEPPGGEGWQMWETTSEGSPMSPVFATPEALAEWLADNGASFFGSSTASKAQWLAVITGEDFAHVQIAPGVIVM